MSWVKIDDQFPDHPKVVQAGPEAAWLYVCGLCYCARYLTDGFIPKAQVKRLADIPNALKAAAGLQAAGLWDWDEERQGYQVHDYLEYNPNADKVKAERDAAKARMNNKRGAKFGRSSGEQPANFGGSSASPSPSPSPTRPRTPSQPPPPNPPGPDLGRSAAAYRTPEAPAVPEEAAEGPSVPWAAVGDDPGDLSNPHALPPDVLLRRFLEAHPEREEQLRQTLAEAKTRPASEAAYLRPLILRILAGREPEPLLPAGAVAGIGGPPTPSRRGKETAEEINARVVGTLDAKGFFNRRPPTAHGTSGPSAAKGPMPS